MVALGFAVDATISFALTDAADVIEPAGAQALQALWNNDFPPIHSGRLVFLLATGGISVSRSGALPRWLGWATILLAIVGVTPIGFVAAIGAATLLLVLSILLSLRARSAAPAA